MRNKKIIFWGAAVKELTRPALISASGGPKYLTLCKAVPACARPPGGGGAQGGTHSIRALPFWSVEDGINPNQLFHVKKQTKYWPKPAKK
jgi:hypothetical protein